MAEIVLKKLSELTLLEKNPRKIDKLQFDKLCQSLQNDPGFLHDRPVLVHSSQGQLQVYAGNQRVRAAKKLGWKEIPCIIEENLTDEIIKARIVKDNTHFGEFDYDILANEFDMEMLFDAGLKPEDFGLDQTAVEQIEGECKEDGEVLEPGKDENAITKPGDIYELGEHRLVCGDSTNSESVDKCFNQNEAALCFTSPPYSDQREYTEKNDLSPLHLALSISTSSDYVEYYAINLGIKRKDGEIVPYWNDWIDTAKSCGLKFLSWNVWDQGFSGSVGKLTAMFPICHEWIFVFGSERKKLNPTVKNISQGNIHVGGTNRNTDGTLKKIKPTKIREFRELGSIYHSPPEFCGDGINHPARFPVQFPYEYIKAMTEKNEGVYDPFLGSGTTLIAAEQLGRKCYGIEISPAYCDIIVNRWIKYRQKNNLSTEFKKNGETFTSLK